MSGNSNSHGRASGSPDVVAPEAMERLGELETALLTRGLAVTVDGKTWGLVATNTATPEDARDVADPLAVAFGPARISQRVSLAWNGDVLAWHWEWPGTPGDSSPELEYICPATEIAEATERVSRVVAIGGRRHPQCG